MDFCSRIGPLGGYGAASKGMRRGGEGTLCASISCRLEEVGRRAVLCGGTREVQKRWMMGGWR